MRLQALLLATLLAACGSSSAPGPKGGPAEDGAIKGEPAEDGAIKGEPTEDGAIKGEPAEVALDVPMPGGTRKLRVLSGAGNEGVSLEKVVLATTLDVAAVRAHFEALPTATDDIRECINVDGARVCVTPLDDIPTTLFSPVGPALPSAPSWARAWISVYRQGSPTPCPPCTEDGAGVLPGCSCP